MAAIERTGARLLRRLHSPFGPDPAVLGEWLRLKNDPVWRGAGVPRGGGTPVVLVPGFAAPSFSSAIAEFVRDRVSPSTPGAGQAR